MNPPVHAWAAWRVYKIDKKRRGKGDTKFWLNVGRTGTHTQEYTEAWREHLSLRIVPDGRYSLNMQRSLVLGAIAREMRQHARDSK